MISKKDFVKGIETIKKYRGLESKFCSVLEEMSNDETYCDAFIYTEYESVLVRTLAIAMGIDCDDKDELVDDTISWWLYDANFGSDKDYNSFMDSDGSMVTINTAEELYDYLYNKYGGR